MTQIFVDTVDWLALLNINDALRTQTQQVMATLQQQNVQLLTTEFVLLEVADALSAPSIRRQTVTFINGLRRLPLLSIIPLNSKLLTDGWDLYSRRLDKDWGLTDSTSFVVMTEAKVKQAFTSDHHFEQAGFTCLLSAR